jgi:hypothetical protein
MVDGKWNYKIISYTTHIKLPNSVSTLISSLLDAPSVISPPVQYMKIMSYPVIYLPMINAVKELKIEM